MTFFLQQLQAPKANAGRRALPLYLLAALAGVLVVALTNGLLPALGVYAFSDILTPETVCMLGFLLVGALAYVAYFRFITQRPAWLVVYSAVLIRVAILIAQTVESTGRHFPLRALHVPILVLPAAYLFFTQFPKLSARYSYFKYVVLFIGLYILYYLFFNHNFIDPSVAKVTGISISKGELTDYLYGFVGLVLTGCMFLKAKTHEERVALFELINRVLIIETIIESVLAIAGYPLGLFTMKIEGFRRTTGFLTHPNEYGKSEGLLLIYFIGLYYYYAKKGASGGAMAITKVLLSVAIVANILGFLLSLSKNSFAGFGLACLIYLVAALFDAQLRKRLILPLTLMGGLLVLALMGYQAASGGKDIMSLLTERFNDTRSLEWRTKAWGYLMSNVNWDSVWTGHGLTASNMEMYRFQYNAAIASEKQSIYVHNAFIQFLYDMGLIGLLIFSGILSAIVSAARRFMTQGNSPLYLAVIGLSVFVIVGALTDECITEMHMNMMYWFMLTMIFSVMQGSTSHERQ